MRNTIFLMFRTKLLWDVLSTSCVWSTFSARDIGADPKSAAGHEQLMQLLCEVNGIDASGSEWLLSACTKEKTFSSGSASGKQ